MFAEGKMNAVSADYQLIYTCRVSGREMCCPEFITCVHTGVIRKWNLRYVTVPIKVCGFQGKINGLLLADYWQINGRLMTD